MSEESKQHLGRVGRPLLFATAEMLEEKIEEYFKGCFEEKWFDEEIRDENGYCLLDDKGKKVYKPIKRLVQIKPITITGLAVALNTSRSTLLNYGDREEFFVTIKKAKDFIENALEEGMLKGDINPTAAIFNAKNNFGWKDKTETDITSDGEKIQGINYIIPNGNNSQTNVQAAPSVPSTPG